MPATDIRQRWANVRKARYFPPDGVSPAVMRLILNGEYDVRVFATAIAVVAAKGWIDSVFTDCTIILTPTGTGTPLARREQILFDRLFLGRDALEVGPSSFVDLKDTQTRHYDALHQEKSEFFSAPIETVGKLETIASKLLPKVVLRRRLRRQAEDYRLYLEAVMRHRLDPTYAPGGQMENIDETLPWVVAFEIENSWGDGLVDALAAFLQPQISTTSIYDLGDRASKRNPGKMARLENAAERRKLEEEDRQRWWF